MNSEGMFHLPYRNFIHLSQHEARSLMYQMLSGEMGTEEIVDLLNFLRGKGETIAELAGLAEGMRNKCAPIDVGELGGPLVDTCGTGGDGAGTFNISTGAALIAAGAGLFVAKHGNRRVSSECGSADVLERLGVPIALDPEQIADCIKRTGIGFIFAPRVHPAVRYAQEARLQLKGRTTFNLLGPLTNPVNASSQVIGAYSVRAAEMIAQAGARLGLKRAFVVHGSDGLDEITTTGPTTVFQVEEGSVRKGRWIPQDFGIQPVSAHDLEGGDIQRNADILQGVLGGEPGPYRDISIVNAAAAIFLAEAAPDLKTAVSLAAHSIDSGAAKQKLEALVSFGASVAHEVV